MRRALLLSTALLLTACGGTPTKADFVDKIEGSVGDDLSSVLEQQGVDASQLDDLITEFVGCQYDAIKDDTDLLNKAYDNPGDADIQARLARALLESARPAEARDLLDRLIAAQPDFKSPTAHLIYARAVAACGAPLAASFCSHWRDSSARWAWAASSAARSHTAPRKPSGALASSGLFSSSSISRAPRSPRLNIAGSALKVPAAVKRTSRLAGTPPTRWLSCAGLSWASALSIIARPSST